MPRPEIAAIHGNSDARERHIRSEALHQRAPVRPGIEHAVQLRGLAESGVGVVLSGGVRYVSSCVNENRIVSTPRDGSSDISASGTARAAEEQAPCAVRGPLRAAE